ncbi:MAG: Transcriptional regulator [Cypionkella sp.]|uniref:helix-turn-helix transcriptional regulator n=1 Tax=Cypionkella sp. TaxID=2811411 RepID=UPI00261BE99C|nr:YafY family protein [Cypionkella sp.]MDB5659307.1 Transcriptional regulator [Cypionkella sp.]
MAKSDRLFRLLTALRMLPQPVTAARLAEEMAVSERTIYRDIDSLRAGGALIDGEAGVGYTLTEDPALPPQMFTQLEVESLVLGLAEVRQMGDPALAKAAEVAMAKIVATLPERVQRQAVHAVSRSIKFQLRAAPPTHVALLREASWAEQEVELNYLDLNGAQTRRRIWPLSIVYFDHALMCLAWCCLREDFRRFHLDRMQDVALTGVSFRPRRVPMLRDYAALVATRGHR